MALGTCKVYTYVYKQDGTPDTDARISARLSRWEVVDDEGYVGPFEVEALADSDGYVEIELVPNQIGSTESIYKIRIEGSERTLNTTCVVPDLPTIALEDIAVLPPYEGKNDGDLIIDHAEQIIQDAIQPAVDAAVIEATQEATNQAGRAEDAAENAEQFRNEAEGFKDEAEATLTTTTPLPPPVATTTTNAEWVDPNTGRRYTLIDDGDSRQWVETGAAIALSDANNQIAVDAAFAAEGYRDETEGFKDAAEIAAGQAQAIAVGDFIDDVTPSAGMVFSSQKVSTDLAAKVSSADLADDTDPEKGAAIAGRATVSVATIADLATAPRDKKLTAVVTSYHSGWEGSALGPVGGGQFYWDDSCTLPHDGGLVIEVAGVATGRWRRLVDRGALSPRWFGAVGDGVTDDGAALNAALSVYRSLVESVAQSSGSLDFDLDGGTYVTTQSLNATGITSWGWQIKNGTIIGKCAGKTVLDMIGSRGGGTSDLIIVGDKIQMPSVGIQAARGAEGGQHGFCDDCRHESTHTRGFFSVVGAWFYGQETTTYDHCAFWNSHPEGAAAFHIGTDDFEYNGVRPMLMQSDYMPPITGETSFINSKYVNCDYRYLPTGNINNVTAISQANPVIVTTNGPHNFVPGDVIVLGGENSATAAYEATGVVLATGADTVTINIDASLWPTYPGSGVSIVKAQSGPTLIFGRGRDHDFDTCYVVAYGDHSMHVEFGTLSYMGRVRLGILFEGMGSPSNVRLITRGAVSKGLSAGLIATYQARSTSSFISTDATSAIVSLTDVEVSVSTTRHTNPRIFDDESRYRVSGGPVVVYSGAAINPAGFPVLRSQLIDVSLANSIGYGSRFSGNVITQPSPGGASSTHLFVDEVGDTKGFLRYQLETSAFIFSANGSTPDYIMQGTAFYPNEDKTKDLGINSRHWRNIYATRIFIDGVGGASGTFTTADGKVVTISKGVITNITAA